MAPDSAATAGGSARVDAQGRAWRLDVAPPGGVPSWRWTHLDLEHPGAAAGLAAEGWLPGDALDLLRETDDAPRLETAGDVAMGVLPDFSHPGPAGPQALLARDGVAAIAGPPVASWRFAMRADRILTGSRAPIPGLAAARRACETDDPPAGPAELVDQVLAGFAAEAARRAAALDAAAREIEDELLDTTQRRPNLSALGARLGRIRREATRLQRMVLPVERLTREDVHDLPGWAGSEAHETARRRILSAVDDLRALAEHGRALQDELGARQAEATTRNLNVLSVLSAVLLPPSLVTGFFGMNTEGLPFKDLGNGTWLAASVALAAVVATLLLLRLRRVF